MDEDTVLAKWDEIKEILKEAPSFSDSVSMLEEIELSYDEFIKFYTREKIDDAVNFAKDLKDRYTVLWLNYRYFNEEK